MDIIGVQQMLRKTGYYKGMIDGMIGPKTMKAVAVIERTQAKQYRADPKDWGDERRAYAAGQAILNAWKYEAGTVDGLVGHNTREAYNAWLFRQVHGKKETVTRPATPGYLPSKRIPTQAECKEYYGTPGKNSGTVRKQLETIELPFALRIDYNLKQKTNKITVHKKAAKSLYAALVAVDEHYGAKQKRKLGLDRYAGAYNPRKMRGGSKWSMHAYGCAIDFYAAPNGLRTKCPQALFCGEAYKPFLDIMERHEWLPAIRLWGKDAMHFQRARL